MAALMRSSWEYIDVLDGGSLRGIWDTSVGANLAATVAAAITGDRGLRVDPVAAAVNYVSKRFAATGTTNDNFEKFDFRVVTSVNTQTQIIALWDFLFGGPSGSIRINTDSTLELWNENAGTQIGSDSAALTANTIYRIELGYIFSTRVITAYLNGVSFASGALDAAADNLDQVHLGIGAGTGIAATGEFNFDSFCLNNQVGANQNTLVGEEFVVLRVVNAAGDNAMGVRVGVDSGSNFGQLDEKPPNDATDGYLLDANNDIIDLGFEDASELVANGVPAGSTIRTVQPVVRHILDAGTNAIGYAARLKSQSGGTVQTGTTITHNDQNWTMNGDPNIIPRIPSLTSYTDPQAGGPWTIPLLDAAQVGVICTDANGDMNLTTLGVYIGYRTVTTALKDVIMQGAVVPFAR
jgi:hypothetical protein